MHNDTYVDLWEDWLRSDSHGNAFSYLCMGGTATGIRSYSSQLTHGGDDFRRNEYFEFMRWRRNILQDV